MNGLRRGTIHLLRVFGIDLYLHWSWFLVAMIQITSRADVYQGSSWKVAEYVALFAIVLLHEFGHALACRSVGGSKRAAPTELTLAGLEAKRCAAARAALSDAGSMPPVWKRLTDASIWCSASA